MDSNVADVAGAASGIWIVKYDGTIWRASDAGKPFVTTGGTGFQRIAGHGNTVFAVGSNGTIWVHQDGPIQPVALPQPFWRKTGAFNIADVADAGSPWLVRWDGKIGFLSDSASTAVLMDENATGFRHIGGHYNLWAVGWNGSVWSRPTERSSWNESPAREMADIDEDDGGKLWLVGKNGTVWKSWDGKKFDQLAGASGFESITAYGSIGALAVGWNGSLWIYRQDNDEMIPPRRQ